MTLPTLVICGTKDPVVPVSHARAVHEAVAGSKLLLVDGGHVPTAEGNPAIAPAVRELLRALPRPR